MRKLIFILLCSIAVAQNPYRAFNNFNGGELSPLLIREDLAKYHTGCSIMENLIPLPQGGAQKRPGTKYIAQVKDSSAKTRLLPFEFSTSQSYIIETGNQYMRFFTNGAKVLSGSGTETLSLDKIIAHWLLNDNTSNTVVLDDDGNTHDGVASTNTENIHIEGQVGTGCFGLDGQYAVWVTDSADFTFVEAVDGDFSITGWIRVTQSGTEQVILSKWDKTTGSQAREWKLLLDETRKLKFCIADESVMLDSDLIAQWKLNDSAATATVVDTVGSNDGALTDGDDNYTSDHSVTGQLVNALDFDGTDDVVTIDDDDVFSFGDGSEDSAFSISAWINMDDATHFVIASKFATGQLEWRFATFTGDNLYMTLYDDNGDIFIGRLAGTSLTAYEGSWIHVVATYDATEASSGINIYVNAIDVDTANAANGVYTAMHNNTGDVSIGYSDDAATGPWQTERWADGKIDNVMVFNKELSLQEVQALRNMVTGTPIGIEELQLAYSYAVTDDAIGIGWRYIAVTYEGQNYSGKPTDDVSIYVDGVTVAITGTDLTIYDKMEDTDAKLRIGAQESAAGVIEKIFADKLDEIAVFEDVLTAFEVAGLYDATNIYEITTPYLTADLFELKYEQSADVLYITHPDYETRKLSRFNNDDWPLDVLDVENGPFKTQNFTVTKTIAASATTGSVTLTASGHAPFVAGTTGGHLPGGSVATSKSQTGALFRLIHPLDTLEFVGTLEDDYETSQTEGVSWMHCGTLYKGADWTLTTRGSWEGQVAVQRNYTIGATDSADGWETVLPYTSGGEDAAGEATNLVTSGTEDDDDADYRIIFLDDQSGTIEIVFTTDQTEVVGVVEITAVASPTSATATVIETLGSTDVTHKWSEGSWSNYRGWPQTVTFFEDRLMFGGNTAQPDTIWGSVTSDYQNMTAGADDDDAVIFTLSSRQVNVIEWLVGKDKLLIGTSGAEWTIEGGADEPLTPSNVIAKQHSTYGSANLQADLANESVLFFQRGKERMRELAYNWELDSYVAPDMTILANLVTNSGINDTAFQKTPASILWCIRNDGELPVFSYERQENITAWSRMVTTDGTSDSDFESIARISGSPEDEIWVIVKRTINGSTVRYIEQFQSRDFGSDAADAYYVDCGITYDDEEATEIPGLDHLKGETVAILADGVVQPSETFIPDPIGHWKMNDDAASTDVDDASTNENDGASVQDTDEITTTGKVGKALSFNGTTDKVTIGDAEALDFGTGDFTMSLWAKINGFHDQTSGFNCLISKGTLTAGSAACSGIYIKTDNKIYFIVADAANQVVSSSTLDDGSFHHIVGVRDSGVVRLYVDGIWQDTDTNTTDLDNSIDLIIGSDAGGVRFFDGDIDNVMIFDKALSPSEVSALYNDGDGTEFTGGIVLDTAASTIQIGLPYEVHLRTMPLSWIAQGPTIQGRQKRISEVIANWYVSGDFSVGRDMNTLRTMSISGQTTSQDRITFPAGYTREGYVYVYQKSPEPLTILALITEFDVN